MNYQRAGMTLPYQKDYSVESGLVVQSHTEGINTINFALDDYDSLLLAPFPPHSQLLDSPLGSPTDSTLPLFFDSLDTPTLELSSLSSIIPAYDDGNGFSCGSDINQADYIINTNCDGIYMTGLSINDDTFDNVTATVNSEERFVADTPQQQILVPIENHYLLPHFRKVLAYLHQQGDLPGSSQDLIVQQQLQACEKHPTFADLLKDFNRVRPAVLPNAEDELEYRIFMLGAEYDERQSKLEEEKNRFVHRMSVLLQKHDKEARVVTQEEMQAKTLLIHNKFQALRTKHRECTVSRLRTLLTAPITFAIPTPAVMATPTPPPTLASTPAAPSFTNTNTILNRSSSKRNLLADLDTTQTLKKSRSNDLTLPEDVTRPRSGSLTLPSNGELGRSRSSTISFSNRELSRSRSVLTFPSEPEVVSLPSNGDLGRTRSSTISFSNVELTRSRSGALTFPSELVRSRSSSLSSSNSLSGDDSGDSLSSSVSSSPSRTSSSFFKFKSGKKGEKASGKASPNANASGSGYGSGGGYPTARRKKSLSKTATEALSRWFNNHIENPYPTEKEKKGLSVSLGIDLSQVNNWFGNKRIRNKRRERDDRERQNRNNESDN